MEALTVVTALLICGHGSAPESGGDVRQSWVLGFAASPIIDALPRCLTFYSNQSQSRCRVLVRR